jgi:hypothetical protein
MSHVCSADVMEHSSAMPQLPSNPFFTSRSDRVELARQRYFEEGQMPSGVISDAVFQRASALLPIARGTKSATP